MVTTTDASAPDTARVFSTTRIARWGVAARNRLRSRSSFAVHRRAPTAVGGPPSLAYEFQASYGEARRSLGGGGRSQARRCTCPALSAVGDRCGQSMITMPGCRSRSAGLGRPRTSGASHALRPPDTRARENGRSDSTRRVRAQRSVLGGPPHAHRPHRICRRTASLTRRGRERSESMSGGRFPARGSRPRTDKAGAASAAAQPRGTARDFREETR